MSLVTPEEIVEHLGHWRYNAGTEEEFQRSVLVALSDLPRGLPPVRREVQLTLRDRIDFMVGDVGIECKIKGSNASVVSQLIRYASIDEVGSLILLTSRMQHQAPPALRDKPVFVVRVPGAFR